MDEITSAIHQFILTNYLAGESPGNLREDTPLRTSGILDSLGTLSLVSFLEEHFGIQIEAHETGIDHFDRIRDIAALVGRKRPAGV
jgi:acyl carrier protein